MFSRPQDAKRRSKEVSLALNFIGFSPSMVKWRQIHYDSKFKTLVCYASNPTSPVPELQMDAFRAFLTGSKQEGASIWGGGDEDCMIALNKYICVHDPNDVTAEPGHVNICVEDAKDKPGYMFLKRAPFTKLDTDNSVLDNLFGICITENNYFSSQMINKLLYCAIQLCEKAISDDRDEHFEASDKDYPSIVHRRIYAGEHTVDIVGGAFIGNKPSTAIIEWASRKRYYDWPSKTLVDRIVNMSSYVIPKGCKGSESRGLEFRISYTLSEVQLIKSLNETQLKVYILLKMLLQSEVDEQFPDIITSYCLKNVVFWLCENASEDQFVIDSLLEWLTNGLIYILDCVRKENLPMYLTPKRNLLEGKLGKEDKPRLEKLLLALIKEGPNVMKRLRKIERVVETLRSNVVVAMAMGYLLHRGEMVLENHRDNATNVFGRMTIPVWMEIFYSTLQQVKDFVSFNPGMRDWLTRVLTTESVDTIFPLLTRLLSGETKTVSRSGMMEAVTRVLIREADTIIPSLTRLLSGATQTGNSSSASLEVLTKLLIGATQSGNSNRSPLEVLIELLRGVTQEGNSSRSTLEVLTRVLTRRDRHVIIPGAFRVLRGATQTGSSSSISSEVGVEEKKQYPNTQKHETDKQKRDCDKEMYDSFERKHDPNEQRRIIEECKKAFANDPSNKEAYTKMGMAYTALGKNWEAAECYREALERDPGNQELTNKLNEVAKLLQEEAAFSGFDFGPGKEKCNFSSLLQGPLVKKKTKELMENEEFGQMMAKIMSGEKRLDDTTLPNPPFTGYLTWEEQMQELLDVAKDLAKRMEKDNPELVEELRECMDQRTYGPSPYTGTIW